MVTVKGMATVPFRQCATTHLKQHAQRVTAVLALATGNAFAAVLNFDPAQFTLQSPARQTEDLNIGKHGYTAPGRPTRCKP